MFSLKLQSATVRTTPASDTHIHFGPGTELELLNMFTSVQTASRFLDHRIHLTIPTREFDTYCLVCDTKYHCQMPTTVGEDGADDVGVFQYAMGICSEDCKGKAIDEGWVSSSAFSSIGPFCHLTLILHQWALLVVLSAGETAQITAQRMGMEYTVDLVQRSHFVCNVM